ncbi:hypothetical protein P280DRAFT_520953 [Massarina eburnea CBS 473.64]|uniref:DUF6536 domain-containing protein n=1 Tax=Massarina eburnea CBS 473.64 TaxID=1395130 RepID=A0A6A6RT42_9PLEO|nr:hypothetical protein P280DRAFT_520953 [Massarina eburnea CBS 473.64]
MKQPFPNGNTGLHVVINVLSTMLLAGSNYTIQVLSSPTREDVDNAHAKGQWLEIGLLSPRNLRAIPWKRTLLWLTMALSSVPLHLFYNAAIFKVVTSNSYDMYTIGTNSADWKTLNETSTNKTNSTYWKMMNGEWISIYNRQYVSIHGDLYFAIDQVAFPVDLSNVQPDYFQATLPINPESITSIMTPNKDWITVVHQFENSTQPVLLHVSEVFSQKITDGAASRVHISLYFMIVVVTFNFLKLLIMLWVLRTDRSAYLVTLGDAAASFLENPDPHTYTKCMLGKDEMLVRLGSLPAHPVSSTEEKEELDLRCSGVWLPRTVRYFYPVDSTGKGAYTVL